MLKIIVGLIRLETYPLSAYSWPIWQSWLLVLLIGVATGLDPSTTAMFYTPIWAVLFSVVTFALAFPVGVAFMSWWLKRDSRWDGQGSLFNLVAAASAIDLLGAGLTTLGVPSLFIFPIFLFSIWIGANAIAGACKVSLRYALGGVVLSFIPMLIVISAISLVLFPIFSGMGVMLPSSGIAL